MISCFQQDYKECVETADNMTMEVFCALTNSNLKFISSVRSFMDKVNRDSGMEIDDIQGALSYSTLIKNFAKISNSAFIRIQELVVFQLNQSFTDVRDYAKLNFENFIMKAFKDLFPIFEMLQPTYSKKLWNHVFLELCCLFSKMAIVLSSKYKVSKRDELMAKLEEDKLLIIDLFEEKCSKKDRLKGKENLESTIKVFKDPTDELIISLVNLRVHLGEVFDDKYMVSLP